MDTAFLVGIVIGSGAVGIVGAVAGLICGLGIMFL